LQQQAQPANVSSSPAPQSTPAANPPVSQNLFQQAAQYAQEQQAAAPAVPANAQLAALQQSPQFQQLRQIIQSQPDLLPAVLEQIGTSNPEVLQV
jgi:UV excision repair protein RAD23